jgi:hypothetical protein
MPGAGCGQNAHVLGPGSGNSSTDGNGANPPGGRTSAPPVGAPTDNGGPTTGGNPKPPEKNPSGPDQGCKPWLDHLHFDGRELTACERQSLASEQSGFATEVCLPPQSEVSALSGAWLELEGDSIPHQGAEGDLLCWMNGGALCASVKGVDGHRINLLRLFEGQVLLGRFYQAVPAIWGIPASWKVRSARLELEILKQGCAP